VKWGGISFLEVWHGSSPTAGMEKRRLTALSLKGYKLQRAGTMSTVTTVFSMPVAMPGTLKVCNKYLLNE
jgi:hypothetical protein